MAPLNLQTALAMCRSRLEECCELRRIPEVQHWGQGRMADFNLWAAGIGANSDSITSLEVRLSRSQGIIGTLILLLESVEVALGKVMRRSNLPRPRHDESTNSASTEDKSQSTFRPDGTMSLSIEQSSDGSLSEIFVDVEALMECLFNLGFLIKQAGRSSQFGKADLNFWRDNYPELEKHLEIILQCKIDVDWCSASKESAASLLSTRLSSGQHNLIEANLRRRHRFIQARQRFERRTASRPAGNEENSEQSNEQKANAEVSSVKTQGVDILSPSADQDPRPRREKKLKKVVFTASTNDHDKLKGKMSGAITGGSRSTASTTSVTVGVTYPRPPTIAKNGLNWGFPCPYCHETLDIAIAESSDEWK